MNAICRTKLRIGITSIFSWGVSCLKSLKISITIFGCFLLSLRLHCCVRASSLRHLPLEVPALIASKSRIIIYLRHVGVGGECCRNVVSEYFENTCNRSTECSAVGARIFGIWLSVAVGDKQCQWFYLTQTHGDNSPSSFDVSFFVDWEGQHITISE